MEVHEAHVSKHTLELPGQYMLRFVLTSDSTPPQ